jgi:hypothetical protein
MEFLLKHFNLFLLYLYQDALSKSNEVFETYKQEMEKVCST